MTTAVLSTLGDVKPPLPPPHNKDPMTMSPDELHDALAVIDRRRQAPGIDNDLRGDSDRNSILGEITDGARNLGIALGISVPVLLVKKDLSMPMVICI